MLYARPALTARASVNTGLRHIHVLNRCPFAGAPGDSSIALAQPSDANSTKVLAYIFPRQFGLHNVFTSATDRQKTAQKFHDYTLREDELLRKFGSKTRPSASALLNIQIPKRLRVAAQHLVQRLQIRHSRCSYSQLLYHHCPTFLDTPSGLQGPPRPCRARQNGVRRGRPGDAPTSYLQSCIEGKSLVELASPIAAVSAFCQATISKIIPNAFWGVGSTGEQNKHVVLKKIDRFIKLRRFESMTLHEIAQDFKLRDVPWLSPPELGIDGPRSLSDTRKRTEIFLEFIYYVFDSLLIPLVRSNFYVTESSTHRLRLFYFRHDVWRLVAEPAMTNLKTTLFEEVRLQDALLMLSQRRLGFAHLRLLPKNASMRPIINLRRRALPQRGGGRFLGPSINSVLAPVQSMFNLEKSRNPSRLGSAMFCVGDMYPRIRAFAASLSDGSSRPRLWFAKVDVQAAFDSIPQAAVLQLMASVPTQSRYTLAKHVEFKPGEMAPASGSQVGRALRRWLTLALDHPEQGEDENMGRKDWQALHQRLNGGLASTHKHTVFVDSGYRRVQSTAELLDLLTQHIEQNLVKVGKKYYRQRQGIPQGSVLSPLLCSYFYADLERAKLGFVASSSDANNSAGSHGPQSLLLRLFDDWLLISTERAKAERFVRLMHAGVPEYGVNINPSKTLVNFDLQIDGRPVPRALDDRSFPYCGVIVDCQSLDIRKDGRVGKDDAIFCSLTVDNSSHAGHSFQRKVIRAFRIQSHPMFFDTAHNSEQAVMSNIYDAFAETAKKMWAHALCIPARQRPLQHLVIDTISKTISAATVLLVGRTRRARYPGYEFTVSKVQITSLACAAFKQVLAGKQAGYAGVIQWLEQRARAVEPGVSHRRRSLKRRHASARIEQARDYGRS